MNIFPRYTGVNSNTGLSPALWKNCPSRQELLDGPRQGFEIFDDFTTFPVTPPTTEGNFGLYKAFTSSGGTVTDGDTVGGAIRLTETDDNEGASIASTCQPFKIIRGGGELWFEARIKTNTVTDTRHGIFLGLIDASTLSATVPIAAAGTLADENFVGFHRLEGDGDAIDTVYKANGVTQVTVGTDAVTIAADTYVKLGMHYNPTTYALTFWANGVKLSSSYTVVAAAGTDFPNDVNLGIALAMLCASDDDAIVTMDWWRCVQLRTS